MKKNTTKPTMSPAPATKPVAAKTAAKTKPAPAPRAKTTAAKAKSPAAAAKPAATVAPVVVKVAAVQAVERKPVVTTIAARIDIGFGNTLYIRGEGTGLSWDVGVPMECAANDLWQITLADSPRGYAFKFLVNDLTWSVGPDYTAENGASVTLTPEF